MNESKVELDTEKHGMTDIKIPQLKFKYKSYIVGGWVRDYFLQEQSKDLDICMVAPSFEDMREAILDVGGDIFIEKPEYLTIRCKIPEFGPVDVAMARKDGDYSDGRRPDSTSIADSIIPDLSRRDFTVNAIAIDCETGEIIDPFNGIEDLNEDRLKTVGNTKTRFNEDYLRMLRAIRFRITKHLIFDDEIDDLLRDFKFCSNLKKISTERIREELFKCFKYDSNYTVKLLSEYEYVLGQCTSRGIWFEPAFKSN